MKCKMCGVTKGRTKRKIEVCSNCGVKTAYQLIKEGFVISKGKENLNSEKE